MAYGGHSTSSTSGLAMQAMALVFERTGGQWKLAAAVQRPDLKGWPALCTRGTPHEAPAELAPGDYAPRWPGC